MTVYFSKQTTGFYDSTLFTVDKLPKDAVEISPETFEKLIKGQEKGLRIYGDENGFPCLGERDTKLSPDQIRLKRNRLLIETDWTQFPDIPESTRSKWTEYRQTLRDIPQQPDFPDNVSWPIKPN